ncbi:MAG: Menaquinone via futalosine step 4, possible alternative [Hydrogenibacillus schlegelii]|uniref:Menaquinone via futalosine step 4, possible alternative n=1 Tax=Hydrogenibacillus schlegelii TaxID=1484 RepID=A0A2T5G7W1_HYDSH|nr:MTAP family purine nucleoside phosphorylase [Hydrogenibacillus schlegelii]PTQ52249.1 MAG: Menaquinone via futalosine step 4, possible alternative [Hydrogenibacillus schlegelii]
MAASSEEKEKKAPEPEPVAPAPFALIGGSSTFSLDFPGGLGREDVRVLERDVVYETPFGPSPPMTLAEVGDKRFWTVKMHGWRPPHVSRADASRQLFWVLREAGVVRIYAEGGVGSVNRLLELRDVIIPDDYIDYTMRQDVSLGSPSLLIMRDPICPTGTEILARAARRRLEGTGRRVFTRGVYLVTDGRHFESRAEVQAFRLMGADVIGQSLVPEVYLAREIGACYTGLYMVVNYAEGVIRDWRHRELAEIFYEEAATIGHILLDALKESPEEAVGCRCRTLRKETLLQEKRFDPSTLEEG